MIDSLDGLVAAARAEDARVGAELGAAADVLGTALATTVTTVNPGRLVLGGPLGVLPIVVDRVRQRIQLDVDERAWPRVEGSTLGGRATGRGLARLVVRRAFATGCDRRRARREHRLSPADQVDRRVPRNRRQAGGRGPTADSRSPASSGIAVIFSDVNSDQRIPPSGRGPRSARQSSTRSGVTTRSTGTSWAAVGITPAGRSCSSCTVVTTRVSGSDQPGRGGQRELQVGESAAPLPSRVPSIRPRRSRDHEVDRGVQLGHRHPPRRPVAPAIDAAPPRRIGQVVRSSRRNRLRLGEPRHRHVKGSCRLQRALPDRQLRGVGFD